MHKLKRRAYIGSVESFYILFDDKKTYVIRKMIDESVMFATQIENAVKVAEDIGKARFGLVKKRYGV